MLQFPLIWFAQSETLTKWYISFTHVLSKMNKEKVLYKETITSHVTTCDEDIKIKCPWKKESVKYGSFYENISFQWPE